MPSDDTLRDLLDCYRDAAWEGGYYAATLEKAFLTDKDRAEYEALLEKAIAERDALGERILEEHGDA